MSGLGMLLKSVGINLDPDKVAADYEQVKKDIALWGGLIVSLKDQMDRIEALLILQAPKENDDGKKSEG